MIDWTCFESYVQYRFFQVQAQKWINMSMKYLYALGDERVPGISKNYEYFHIPIDNIILNELKSKNINMIH